MNIKQTKPQFSTQTASRIGLVYTQVFAYIFLGRFDNFCNKRCQTFLRNYRALFRLAFFTLPALCSVVGGPAMLRLKDLVDLVERERQLQGDFEALPQHNRRFHAAVHRGAHNRYLEKSLMAINDLGLMGSPLMSLPHRAQSAAAEHAQIVEAIQRRDPAAAEEAARAHVRAAQRERLKRLFPETES